MIAYTPAMIAHTPNVITNTPMPKKNISQGLEKVMLQTIIYSI